MGNSDLFFANSYQLQYNIMYCIRCIGLLAYICNSSSRIQLTLRLPSYFCDIGYQGVGVVTTLLRFSVWFKISYRV